MFFYDPTFLLLIPGLILAGWAQFKVQSTFSRYSRVPSNSGITGAQVARKILDANGIYDVSVEATRGNLTDHYHPTKKKLFLSESVYNKSSIAAICVAAHEVGHAIQHQKDYKPLSIRSVLVPVASFGSYTAWILFFAGLIFSMDFLLEIGIVLFSAVVLFQLVTLPVEFNASSRALAQVSYHGFLTNDELRYGKKVLNAAAWTYVAAAMMAILQLLRLLIIFGGVRRD
jgi:hypothetical protein